MPPKGKGRAKAAASHQLAKAVPKGTQVKDLRNKLWFIGDPVGSGGFGLIYLADDNKDKISAEKAQYVIKVEPKGNGPLFCEIAFYQRAAKSETISEWTRRSHLFYVGIPPYIAHGLHSIGKEDLRFMVMPRFGCDLHKLWLKSDKKFRRDTVCQLAIELINALEYMHDNDYVHADVKGANILLGYKDPNQVYLVDFGLAFRYNVDGKHTEYKEDPKKAHDGTIEYTSRDAHLGVSPSRRSDLEILGYVLLHWLSGKLPWEDNLSNKNYVKEQKMKYMENVKDFVQQVYPESKTFKANEIEKFLMHVSNLKYDAKPNYQLLRKYFEDTLKSMKVPPSSNICFDSGVPVPSSTSAPAVRRKRAQNQKSKKNSKNQSNSQSDADGEEIPVKKVRRAPVKREQISVSSEDEESSTGSSSNKIRSKKMQSKKDPPPNIKPVKKTRKVTKKARTSSSDETSSMECSIDANDQSSVEITSDENDQPLQSTHGGRKKGLAKSKLNELDRGSFASMQSDILNDIDSNSTGSFQKVIKTKDSPTTRSMSGVLKSRYSMAPLHTNSVLGNNDKLTGEYSGKHPVIIRRRKVNRPKADAETQTTPGLKKQASRIKR